MPLIGNLNFYIFLHVKIIKLLVIYIDISGKDLCNIYKKYLQSFIYKISIHFFTQNLSFMSKLILSQSDKF